MTLSAKASKTYSHMSRFEVQVRHAEIWLLESADLCLLVPLFWTQTGYGLKPPPLLATDRTHAQNLDALKRHFMKTIPVYGPHVRWYLPV
jgi:hypothetical protein